MIGFRVFSGRLALLGLTFLLFGCGGSGLPPDATPSQILGRAEAKIQSRDFLEAAELLEDLIRANPGASLVPQAKIRLGDARYGMEEYILARADYEDVVEDFPTSPFVEDARFKITQCAFAEIHAFDRDPTDTEVAIELLGTFIRDFPQSDRVGEAQQMLSECRSRLAKREFETGRFYEGRRRRKSAIIQYKYVAETYSDSEWARQSLLRLGELHTIREEMAEAEAAYRKLIEIAPESAEAREAEAALARIAPLSSGATP